MSKRIVYLLFAVFSIISAMAQPSATITTDGATSFCQNGQARLKIGFNGTEPFGYSIKITKTGDGSLYGYSTNLGSNNLGIYAQDLTNGFYIDLKNIDEGYTYELIEVFDKNKWPSNPLTYQYSGGVPQGSTSVSGTAVFLVDAMPVADAGIAQTVCGLSAQLQAIRSIANTQIFWEIPAQGGLSDLNSANPVFTAPTTGTYTLTVNEKNGTCTDQDQVAVTLQGSPKAVLSGESSVCGSGNIQASMALQGNSPWSFYVKNQDGSHVVNQTNVTSANYAFAIATTGTQTYTIVSVTDKNGCTAVASDLSGSAKSTDIKAVVDAGDDKTVCGGTTQVLQGTSSLATGTIKWTSLPASTISPNNNLTTTVSVSGNKPETLVEYTLEIDNSGCKSSDKVLVRFAPLPQLSVLSPETAICEGSSTSLELGVDVAGTWDLEYKENGSLKTAQFQTSPVTIALSPSETTDYVFTKLTDKNQCSSVLDDSWLLSVEPLQPADAGDDLHLERQYNATLTAEPLLTGSAGEWRLISGSKAVIANVSEPQTQVSGLAVGENKFEWKVAAQVCPETKDTVVITVDKYTTYNGFSPNGDNYNETFVIEGANSDEENELSVFTAKGKLVYHETNYKNGWKGVDMSGSPLDSGTYYFVFTSKGNSPIKEYLIIRR